MDVDRPERTSRVRRPEQALRGRPLEMFRVREANDHTRDLQPSNGTVSHKSNPPDTTPDAVNRAYGRTQGLWKKALDFV